MTAPSARTLSVIDYHTEGEPMRIVVGGVDAVPGATLMERSEYLAAHGRDLLGFTLYEPRRLLGIEREPERRGLHQRVEVTAVGEIEADRA